MGESAGCLFSASSRFPARRLHPRGGGGVKKGGGGVEESGHGNGYGSLSAEGGDAGEEVRTEPGSDRRQRGGRGEDENGERSEGVGWGLQEPQGEGVRPKLTPPVSYEMFSYNGSRWVSWSQ